MPLYEYECDSCGERFEVIEKFSDEPLRTHEKCGGAVHRLISAPALQFKGSGWYITDYAKSKSAAPAENGAPAKTESKTDSSKSSGSEAPSSTPAPAASSDTKSTSEKK